jgi:hypothetical protein
MKSMYLLALIPVLIASPATGVNGVRMTQDEKIAAVAAQFGASETCVRESLLKSPDLQLAKINCGLGAGGPIIQCEDDQKCCRVGVTAWCCDKNEKCGDLGDCISKRAEN